MTTRGGARRLGERELSTGARDARRSGPLPRADAARPRYTTLLDFAGDSVVAAVVRRAGADDSIELLGIGRRVLDPVPHPPHELPGGESLVQRCEQAISEAEDSAQVIPRQAVLSVRGELVHGALETAEAVRPNPAAPVVEEEVRDLVDDLTNGVAPEARARLRHGGVVGWNAAPLSPAIIETHLDSRRVPTAVGLTGESLHLAVFLGWVPQALHDALHDLAQQLDLEVQAVSAGGAASGRGAALASGDLSEATVVDIAGASTDIAVLRHRTVQRTRGFASGTASWTRRIATQLGCTIDEALRLRRAAAAGTLRGPRVQQQRRLAAEDLAIWVAALEVAFTDLSEPAPLPAQIVLAGDALALPEVRVRLLRHQWPPTVRFDRRPNARVPRGLAAGRVRDQGHRLSLPQEAGIVGLAAQTGDAPMLFQSLKGTAATPAAATP